MRWHGRRVQVYAYTRPTDMRKGCDGLCALVTLGLHRDPLSGDIFIFVSRDRIRAKTLQWDGTGLCLYAKRLERGRFAPLWRAQGNDPITLTISELALFLDGSTLVGRVALAPPAITQFSPAADHESRSNGRRMVELTKEHDLETLRQISLLLDRENQRLITKTLELTAEVARLRGVADPEQLQLAVLRELEQRRAQVFHRDAAARRARQP